MSTQITLKVVSTMKHFAVSDVLGVDVRKDVKKVKKLLGKANGGGANITNTYSTKLSGYNVSETVEDDVLQARIDVIANIIRYLDSQDTDSLRQAVKTFHTTVAAEKQKLSDEYGSTTIPAERYKAYLTACKKVEVTLWATQLVVTKVSDQEFPDAVYNVDSGRYHSTVKTKTVYTTYPIKAEALLNAGVIKECFTETKKDDGTVEKTKYYALVEMSNEAGVNTFKRSASGRVEIAEVVDKRSGEKILVLRKKTIPSGS